MRAPRKTTLFPYTTLFRSNGAEQEGVGWYQVTIKDGKRCSAAVAYLHPAMDRPNLRVETRALRSEEHTSELQSQSNIVCRLLLDKKTLGERLTTHSATGSW